MRYILVVLLFLNSLSAYPAENWSRIILSGGPHVIIGFVPDSLDKANTINIFIEGDGKPGLALAMAQYVGGNSIYLARPCQYVNATRYASCGKEIWTSHRFSESVIDSTNRAITAVKLRFNATKIRVIGFSGGGAVASIVASKRSDVALLMTVAGNLNHKLWTDYNHSKPLSGSLNPIDFVDSLSHVEQIHIVGDKDVTVPFVILESYLHKLKSRDQVGVYVVEGADHTCCWSIAVADVLSGF